MTSEQKMPSIDDPQFRITPYQQLAASTTGALTTSLIMTPLDVVKIRLQIQKNASLRNNTNKCFMYCNGLMDHMCHCEIGETKWYNRPGEFKGSLDAIYKISKTEGVTSLWAGLSPTLVLALPATVVYFVSYEQLRTRLCDRFGVDSKNKDNQPLWIPMMSGATARVGSVTMVSPLELMRTKMQAQKLSWSEIIRTLKSLLKTDGIRGLWKGLTPTLLRDVPFSAIYWGSYETMKSKVQKEKKDEMGEILISFVAGSIAASIAAFVTTPFDVVKTHQQVSLAEELVLKGPASTVKQTTFATIKSIFKASGVSGIFAGLIPRILKVVPACAIMVSTFEYGKLYFKTYNYEQYLEKNEK